MCENNIDLSCQEFLSIRNQDKASLSPLLQGHPYGAKCWLGCSSLRAQLGEDLLPSTRGGWQDSVPRGCWSNKASSPRWLLAEDHPAVWARPTWCPASSEHAGWKAAERVRWEGGMLRDLIVRVTSCHLRCYYWCKEVCRRRPC